MNCVDFKMNGATIKKFKKPISTFLFMGNFYGSQEMYKEHSFPLLRLKYYFSSVTVHVIIKVAAFELRRNQLSFLPLKTL